MLERKTGRLVAVDDAGTGPRLWHTISLGAPVWATPVAANCVLYIASTRYLWAVEAGK